jgi:integrase
VCFEDWKHPLDQLSETCPMARPATGIRPRRSRTCRSREDGKCNCDPSYEAWAWSARDGKKIRRTFHNHAEAKGWRGDATNAVRRGTLRTPTRTTLREAGEKLIAGMRSGEVRTRKGGRLYKPSVIRTYESDLAKYIYDDLGACRLSEVRRRDVQELADRLVGRGLSGSKVRNVITALKVIYRRELEHDDLAVNPTTNLRLPEVDGSRDWDATPEQALVLLYALGGVRPIYATAMLAGLRRGELRALRVSDVHGLREEEGEHWISVERSWDDREGVVDPKSKAGVRKTLLCPTLRRIIAEHVARTGRGGDELLFGKTATEPFVPWTIGQHADTAWTAAELERVTLHQCRHGFDSFLDAAGVSEARADRYMGHAQNTVGDRYRHRLRGQLADDANRLDEYLHGEVAEVIALPTGAHSGAQEAQTASLSGTG